MTFLYITCPDRKTAVVLSTAVLKSRVAGCTNFFPIESVYWWRKKLEKTREYVLIIKTPSQRAKAVKQLIKKLHPYTTPCIAEIKVKMDRAYEEWIWRETRSGSRHPR